jgi:hypothetical protein
MSAVFCHNDDQRRLALLTRDQEAARRGSAIATDILPATPFYLAEDYHQKYLLRHQRRLMEEFRAMYPDDRQFMNSTAAARVNGYLGGYGSRQRLEKEVEGWGLSPQAQQELREYYPQPTPKDDGRPRR